MTTVINRIARRTELGARQMTVAGGLIAIALFSLLLTGFRVDGNNLFHLIILDATWREPQFADDSFVQSLRHFSSGFWQLQAGLSDNVQPDRLLLFWAVLSRIVLCVGVASWGLLFGIEDERKLLTFVALFTVLAVSSGYSLAGGGGLLINKFTHSELCNGLVLLALAAFGRQHYGSGIALCGLVFFINAFMAVWLFPLMLAVFVLQWPTLRSNIAAAARRALPGIVFALLLSIPVIADVVQNPEFGQPLGYDYRDFLITYWPMHFFAQHQPVGELLGFGCLVIGGAALVWFLPEQRKLLWTLGGALLALWCFGALLPFLTASPALLNLHLLRSTALLHLFVGIVIALHVTRLLFSQQAQDRQFWSPAILLLGVGASITAPIIAGMLHLRMTGRFGAAATRPWISKSLTGFIILLIAATGMLAAVHGAAFSRDRADWVAVAEWARHNTAISAQFLLPTHRLYADSPLPKAADRMVNLASGSEVFIPLSHRRDWVSGKAGAAVMWTPRYAAEWMPRVTAALAARSFGERMTYARQSGIEFLVDGCSAAGSRAIAYRAGRLCVFAVDQRKGR